MSIKEIHSDAHFHKSLEFLRLSNYQLALESIDLAITSSHSKDFYMFQKVKILFVAQMFAQCSDYITRNLTTLYKQSSLYIFSHLLYYHQASSGCLTPDLEDLLRTNSIPSILAKEYPLFLSNPDTELIEKILISKEAQDYTACIDYCNLFLNKDTSNITVYLIKAKCHCLLGAYDLGILTYEKAIDLEPKAPSIYNEIGTIMLEIENFSRAIFYFQKAHDLDPSSLYFSTQLAEGFYLWKKYDSALLNFKKVLTKNPRCSETLLRIADIYDQTNKPKKAKKYYKKVLNCG